MKKKILSTNKSIDFFDQQFRNQPLDVALQLNPFESAALPYLRGKVLDFGSGGWATWPSQQRTEDAR